MTRILVTGANGHLGANTTRSLLKRGYQVVAYVRQGADLRGLQGLPLELRRGDVMDYPALLEAGRGCQVIIHHAAPYRMWAKRAAEIREPARVGTQQIFKAAQALGVRRLIYTSSAAAVGSSKQTCGLRDEGDWNEHPHTAYFTAKVESERLALELSQELNVPTLRLCPSTVLGPYDYRLTPSTLTVLNLVNGSSLLWKGGANYLHAGDAGEAHAAAVELGQAGERYLIGGDNVPLDELGELIEQFTGVRPRRLPLSGPPLELAAGLVGLGSRLAGKTPPFDRKIVQDVVGAYAYYDNSLARRTFALKPRSIEQTLLDTLRWLHFTGRLPARLAARAAGWPPADSAWSSP